MANNRKKLLIIEDDPEISEDIKEIFEYNGFDIFTSYNGAVGIQVAMSIIPDLIICDITMPILNGYEVKKQLSEVAATANIPFIFFTASADLESMRRAMDLGADDYIVKPIQVENLLSIVNNRINRINSLKYGILGKNKEKVSLPDEKIMLKNSKELFFTTVENISVIKSLGAYSQAILSNGKKSVIKRSLKKWETLIPGDIFIKVHRNYIINLNLIEKMETGTKGTYLISSKGCADIIMSSQRYSQKIRKMSIKGL